MVDMQPLRDNAIGQAVGDTMRARATCVSDTELSVALRRDSAHPRPTLVRSTAIYLEPEAVCEWGSSVGAIRPHPPIVPVDEAERVPAHLAAPSVRVLGDACRLPAPALAEPEGDSGILMVHGSRT